MLQRVGIGQARFSVPGLVTDARGVAVGRQMALRFSGVDRLVSFLRLLSSEQALDDLQPGLRIVQARATGGAREALVLFPVGSAALADVAARAARTVGGHAFTGAAKHFVQYRDVRAPLGYDVVALSSEPADVLLYSEDHTLAYAQLAEIPLEKLLLRLDLARAHGAAEPRRELLYLMVRRGLGPVVIEHLHRAQRSAPGLRAAAALCDPAPDAAGGAFQRAQSFWVLRIEDLPARLLGLLGHTPGLLAPVADNVAVAVGFRHPVHLEACKVALPPDRLFLFAPPPAGVTVIGPPPSFTPIADLVRLRGAWGRDADAGGGGVGGAPAVAVPSARVELTVALRLQAAPAGLAHAVATLIPWDRAARLRALCYALPPAALRGYRVAVLGRGLLVIAPSALEGFPLGTLLHQVAPGVLVPLGMEIRPAITPEPLAERLGATGGAVVVFPGAAEAPFRVPPEAIEALEARTLSDPRLGEIGAAATLGGRPAREQPIGVEIENRPLGAMPLWGLGR